MNCLFALIHLRFTDYPVFPVKTGQTELSENSPSMPVSLILAAANASHWGSIRQQKVSPDSACGVLILRRSDKTTRGPSQESPRAGNPVFIAFCRHCFYLPRNLPSGRRANGTARRSAGRRFHCPGKQRLDAHFLLPLSGHVPDTVFRCDKSCFLIFISRLSSRRTPVPIPHPGGFLPSCAAPFAKSSGCRNFQTSPADTPAHPPHSFAESYTVAHNPFPYSFPPWNSARSEIRQDKRAE